MNKDKKQIPNKFDFTPWLKEDLWNENEFQRLCCGIDPKGGQTLNEELNEAIDKIRRGVLAGKLKCKEPDDMTQGDRHYYKARFFYPAEVISWASKNFPKFPFITDDLESGNEKAKTREKATLLKMIAALAIALSKHNVGRYMHGENLNASNIANDVQDIFTKDDKYNKAGLGKTNIRNRISEGMELIRNL